MLLLLLTIIILIYLNIKTGDNIGLIGEFKYQTLDTIKANSLDTKNKFDLLNIEASKFSGQILEDTSHVREAVNYLIGLIGLFIVVELGFLYAKRKAVDK